jgi:tRNA 2-selenouridine synthase
MSDSADRSTPPHAAAFGAAAPRALPPGQFEQLGIQAPGRYALVIDARSPREFAEDHIAGAVNLPVVNDAEYAEVGTLHRQDPHAAYLLGVRYSLANIATQLPRIIEPLPRYAPILVYCFRGGKRSKLWADNLRTIGFRVDVLQGGWKRYRAWVREALNALPQQFRFQVLVGPTGCGKTRVLQALADAGEQVLDLESLANHRGSLIGGIPGLPQPSQKHFDSLLLHAMQALDPSRVVWLEGESKRIGKVQLPTALYEALLAAPTVGVDAPMAARVQMWKEDFPHFVTDPVGMVEQLEPIRALVSGETYERWQALAGAGHVDELFERVMREHYDPCYTRSLKKHVQHGAAATSLHVQVADLGPAGLASAAQALKTLA